MTVLDKDKGSDNPRIQCGECGQWKRLHGMKDGKEFSRFHGCCDVTRADHPCGSEVCSECCPVKCSDRLAHAVGGSQQ